MAAKYSYAGFWIRFLAFLIDIVFTSIIGYLIFGEDVVSMSPGNFEVAFNNWETLVPLTYVLGSWIWISATPGKYICGIKIIEENGKNLSWQKALVRLLAYIPSGLAIGLGFIWIAFDEKKQGWHDKIAKTYVVKR